MKSNKDSNLYVDKTTKNKLSNIAKKNNMTMIALIRKWIKENK